MTLWVDIEKRLGNFQLKVQLAADNEVMGLLGASGCGKSVTLKAIAGILTPDKGQIVVNGQVLFDSAKHIDLSPQKRQVGYLFQNYALFPNMTVEQNIAAGIRLPKAERSQKTAENIRRFYLQGLEKHYPRQLSGGHPDDTYDIGIVPDHQGELLYRNIRNRTGILSDWRCSHAVIIGAQ